MQIAMIGLGKMGGNMVRRLLRGGHTVVAYDRDPEAVKKLAAEGAMAAHSLSEVAQKLSAPRVAWVMVPAGGPTESTIAELAGLFAEGDIIIDGGNSNHRDSRRYVWRRLGPRQRLLPHGRRRRQRF
jgi:6-phosphogluconate dehydrogenase